MKSDIVVVDLEDATYLGSSEDGVYFDVAKGKEGWFVGAVVDCNTSHWLDTITRDDGPYEKESEAWQAGYNIAYDWLVTNHVRGWRTDAAKLARKYNRMAKDGK